MQTHWVIAGCRGQLGYALGRQLAEQAGCEVLAAADLPEVDISDPKAVGRLLDGLDPAPDFLVNAAAFTHVDRCEREPKAARRANAVAPGVLAEACARVGSRLVHVSTDYVFAGDAERPYSEEDAPAPRSVYGRTKLEGEERVRAVSEDFLLVRTSWVYGRGRNFLAAILAQAEARRRGEASGPLRVVDDQRGRPTYAEDLAAGIRGLVEREGAVSSGRRRRSHHLVGAGAGLPGRRRLRGSRRRSHPDRGSGPGGPATGPVGARLLQGGGAGRSPPELAGCSRRLSRIPGISLRSLTQDAARHPDADPSPLASLRSRRRSSGYASVARLASGASRRLGCRPASWVRLLTGC
jgi:dTDP-4-dehydrorhamnose reductase